MHLVRHSFVLFAAAALLAACSPSSPPPQGPAGGGAMPPMPATVRTVRQQSVPVMLESVGQAEGSKEVEVRARVTGLIERQHFAEGERVKAGAPLFTLERASFDNALAQARAALQQEQARAEQTRREAARLKPLAEQQAIPQREADDAASAARLAEAALAAAQARVKEAELNLSYTTVTAPIGGVTLRAERSQGNLVTPADGLLTRIVQTDPLWVRFSFSESERQQLGKAKGATVRLLGPDGRPVGPAGRLNFSGSTVDARLGTVQVRAEFPNPGMDVLPGQFVRAQVQAGSQSAWLVPQAAVMTSAQGRMVWVLREGKATPAPVEVAGWVGSDWAVRSGLKDGDQVIVDNLLKLRPGAPIQPQEAGAAAAPAAAASGAAAAPAPAASAASR